MCKTELYKLIDLHADNPSSDYKYEHYAIAGRLVDRRIYTIEQYKKECAELGIMSYDSLAQAVFHSPKTSYEVVKDWYVSWILTESNDAVGEIKSLIDKLPDKETSELLCQFQEDMEQAGKPVPSTLAL